MATTTTAEVDRPPLPPSSPTSISTTTTSISGRQQRGLQVDVLLLDGTLRQVELDCRANGQDCLEKVCRCLGVFEEVDYFGLTFHGPRQEELWVNTRNRLYKQLPASAAGVARLQLRVKFYAPPHVLMQEETRHLVFLDVRSRLADQGHWLLDDGSTDWRLLAQLAALMAQAEFGDYTDADVGESAAVALPPLARYRRYFWRESEADENNEEAVNAALCLAAELHRRLAGTSRAAAEYRTLQAASEGLPMYGCHYHEAKDCYENRISVAVGPNAICLCRPDGKLILERYAYPRVQKVTISDRVLYLSLSQENGAVKEQGYRLISQKAANGLYRCVTETHSFFRCDTVRNDVAAQTSRDVKGALVSLFVERDNFTTRDFVFDVQRTAKEVHDDARRQMYKCASAAVAAAAAAAAAAAWPSGKMAAATSFVADTCTAVQATCKKDDIENSGDNVSSTGSIDSESRSQLLDRIRTLEQARLCRICMDASICVVFLPCGHMLACRECSEQLAACAVCRVPISVRQACYVPWLE